MALPIPGYVGPFESIARTLITVAALTLIWTGASRMEGKAATRYLLAGLLSAALVAWVALAQYLGATNTYVALTDDQPQSVALPLALLLPVTVTAGAIWMSQSVMRLASAIPLWALVAIQFYRVAGGIFIILWASDRLPWQFALPAGIGDFATGIAAIWVAALLARKADNAPRAAYLWCVFGIADLVVAVTMGMLTSPGPLHLLALSEPNRISAYPLVMIPTFAVPLAVILHGVVLWRLRGISKEDHAGHATFVEELV